MAWKRQQRTSLCLITKPLMPIKLTRALLRSPLGSEPNVTTKDTLAVIENTIAKWATASRRFLQTTGMIWFKGSLYKYIYWPLKKDQQTPQSSFF